jgi:hypothetical protein
VIDGNHGNKNVPRDLSHNIREMGIGSPWVKQS